MTTDRRGWFQITLSLARGPMPRADRYLRRDGVDYVLAQEEPGQWAYRPANRRLTKIERTRDRKCGRVPSDA